MHHSCEGTDWQGYVFILVCLLTELKSYWQFSIKFREYAD